MFLFEMGEFSRRQWGFFVLYFLAVTLPVVFVAVKLCQLTWQVQDTPEGKWIVSGMVVAGAFWLWWSVGTFVAVSLADAMYERQPKKYGYRRIEKRRLQIRIKASRQATQEGFAFYNDSPERRARISEIEQELGKPPLPNKDDYFWPLSPKIAAKQNKRVSEKYQRQWELEQARKARAAEDSRIKAYEERMKRLGAPPEYFLNQKLSKREQKQSANAYRILVDSLDVSEPRWLGVILGLSGVIRGVGFIVGLAIAVLSIFRVDSWFEPLALAMPKFLPGFWFGVLVAVGSSLVAAFGLEWPAYKFLKRQHPEVVDYNNMKFAAMSSETEDVLLKYELARLPYAIELASSPSPESGFLGLIQPMIGFDRVMEKVAIAKHGLHVAEVIEFGGFVYSPSKDAEERNRVNEIEAQNEEWLERERSAIEADQAEWNEKKRVSDEQLSESQRLWEESYDPGGYERREIWRRQISSRGWRRRRESA